MKHKTRILPGSFELVRLLSQQRPPDLVIKRTGGDYLHRWHIRKDQEHGNVYLHRFLGDDEAFALHDHPWESVSFILQGHYREHFPDLPSVTRNPGDIIYRGVGSAHRVELISAECWTLFVTGPKVREWGFHCPSGWKSARELSIDDGNGNHIFNTELCD